MKIAITGGAGFIGSHVVDAYISAGHEVVVLDNFSTGKRENINPDARVVEIDITSADIDLLFKNEKFDILNHHAAQIDVRVSVNDPLFDARLNILGGINLYEASVKYKVKKIIFASSGGTVYGEQEVFPADETHPTRPLSPYGIAKLTNEHYLYYYANNYKIDYVALRYGNVYGPRQNPHGEAGVVAIFANKLLDGTQPIINGDGKQTRDYVYVSDVARANVLALREQAKGIYNIGTGEEIDVNIIFRTLRETVNPQCEEIHGNAQKGEQKRSCLSYQKIYDELGWKPQMDFTLGLKQTVGFFYQQI